MTASQKSLKDKEKEMEYKKQVNASKTDKIITNVFLDFQRKNR